MMRAPRKQAAIRFFQAAIGGLLLSTPVSAATLTWDASGASANNPTDGPGTWDLSHVNWSNGSTDLVWPNDTTVAIFGNNHGTAGTVTVGTPITAGGITFNAATSGSYNIAGTSTITLSGSTPTVTINGAATSATIAAPVIGSSGLYVAGRGTLTLSGSNTYSGGTNLSGGTLLLASTHALGAGTVYVGASAGVSVNANTTPNAIITNLGDFAVASGATLNAAFYGFNQSGGTLTNNGTFNLSGGTFYDLGGTISGNAVNFTTGSGVVTFGPSAPGAKFAFTGSSTYGYLYGSTSSINVPSGAIVTAQATAGSTFLGLTTPANYGNLTVTSASGYSSTLSLSSSFVNHGTITLAQAGTPSSVATVNGFTNATDGTFNVNTNTKPSGGITNLGAVTIGGGFALDTGGYGFNQSGGTLTINGALNLSGGGTFYDLGGTITGNSVNFNGGSGTVTFGPSAPAATFAFSGTSVYGYLYGSTSSINVPSGAIVTAQATAGSTFLGVTAPANYGNLTVTSASGYSSTLSLPYGNFINHGTITLAQSGTPSSPAAVNGNFFNANDGTFNVNTNTKPSSVITNLGTLTIGTGAALDTGGYGFNQSGGTLTINGALNLSGGGTFYDLGGTITGNSVNFNGSGGTVTFGPSAPGATFAFNGTSVYGYLYGSTSSINVPSGAIVTAQATAGSTFLGLTTPANYGNLTVTSASGYSSTLSLSSSFVNHGTITLAQAGTPSSVATVNGFTNATDGTFNVNTNTKPSSIITNLGAFTIGVGATLDTVSYGFNQSGGTLAINGALNLSGGGTFYDLGGTITGNSVNFNGSGGIVTFGPSAPAATFAFNGTSVYGYLYGSTSSINVPSGAIVTAQATAGSTFLGLTTPANYGNLTVTSASGYSSSVSLSNSSFVNHGTITLAQSGTPSSAASISGFTNATDGIVNFNTSTTVNGNLINQGTMNIKVGTFTLGSASYSFNQAGGMLNILPGEGLNLPGSSQFLIAGGTVLLGGGSIPGTLGFTGLLWPNPSVAMNPATDVAFINSTAVLAGESAGGIGLYSQEVNFNIADPNATLTVNARLTNGSLDKSGPGTLVINGLSTLSGTIKDLAGTLTIGPGALLPNNNAITVASGATLNVQASIPNDVITNNGTVNFPAGTGTTPNVVQIGSLTIPAGKKSTIAPAANQSGRTLVVLNTLNLITGGTTSAAATLDLTNNDLDITAANAYPVAYAEVKQGFANGAWTGLGITSSTAANDPSHLTALGIIQNNQGGSPLFTAAHQFDGFTPGVADTLIKYTYYGDADFSGKVDGSDYSRIDSSITTQASGWYNGDFNYDGVINGSDYTLIDNAFNTQGAMLSASIAVPTAVITSEIAGSSVPEPGTLALIALAAPSVLSRRRFKR